MRHRADLIVPIRDRRQGRRVVTLKNFGWVGLGVGVLILVVTIQSDMRGKISDDYGRLFGKQVSHPTEVTPKTIDVVTEAPVPDQTAADPLLIQPSIREQYLGDRTLTPPPAVSVVSTSPPVEAPRGSGVSIVGDGSGVTIVRGKAERPPTLSGGVFRQQ